MEPLAGWKLSSVGPRKGEPHALRFVRSIPFPTARSYSPSPSIYASTSASTDDYSPTLHVLRRAITDVVRVLTDRPDGAPGIILAPQSFNHDLTYNPHIHALATEGLVCADDIFSPVPTIDALLLEHAFRRHSPPPPSALLPARVLRARLRAAVRTTTTPFGASVLRSPAADGPSHRRLLLREGRCGQRRSGAARGGQFLALSLFGSGRARGDPAPGRLYEGS